MEPTKQQREAAREIVRKHERRVMVEQGFHDDTISAIAQALHRAHAAGEREGIERAAVAAENEMIALIGERVAQRTQSIIALKIRALLTEDQ